MESLLPMHYQQYSFSLSPEKVKELMYVNIDVIHDKVLKSAWCVTLKWLSQTDQIHLKRLAVDLYLIYKTALHL